MKKRLLPIILIFALLLGLSLTACGNKDNGATPDSASADQSATDDSREVSSSAAASAGASANEDDDKGDSSASSEASKASGGSSAAAAPQQGSGQSNDDSDSTTPTTTPTETPAAEQSVTGTAYIKYDGSAETNAPASSGTEGFFSDVQASVAGGFVSAKFGGLKAEYPKWESATYTGDDGTKNGTKS